MVSEPTDPKPTDPAQGPVRRLRVRRAPRYKVFLATGALIGLVVALVTGSAGPVDPQTGRAKLIGYLAMGLILLGGLLGGLVAVALERFSRRSSIDVGRPGRGRSR
jgi:MFS family permease